MRTLLVLLLAGTATLAAPAAAQLLPHVGGAVRDVISPLQRTLDPVSSGVASVASGARKLAQIRTERLAVLVRAHRDAIELDLAGQPARKGELLLVGANPEQVELARRAGFELVASEELGELELSVVRLRVADGSSLAKAQQHLQRLLPEATIATDQLHFAAGGAGAHDREAAPPAAAPIQTPVGMIDGAPGARVQAVEVRGFARGAPLPSHHGSAVASLLGGAGVRKVLVADVYGADPAGGNALAIAKGLDWLLRQQVRVISISLVGPNNPLLERAIAAAQRKGTTIVAAVGNDGPAAPPSYPASYPGVLAVTAVDGRNRALIEAGRARHLDYAAPGADILAANAAGKWNRVRGTSYAVPLVAARTAAALEGQPPSPVPQLDREAVDLGAKGPDATYGRGLLCGSCRPRR